MGYSLWSCKESETTERLSVHVCIHTHTHAHTLQIMSTSLLMLIPHCAEDEAKLDNYLSFELIYKTEIESQMYKSSLRLPRRGSGEG